MPPDEHYTLDIACRRLISPDVRAFCSRPTADETPSVANATRQAFAPIAEEERYKNDGVVSNPPPIRNPTSYQWPSTVQ